MTPGPSITIDPGEPAQARLPGSVSVCIRLFRRHVTIDEDWVARAQKMAGKGGVSVGKLLVRDYQLPNIAGVVVFNQAGRGVFECRTVAEAILWAEGQQRPTDA